MPTMPMTTERIAQSAITVCASMAIPPSGAARSGKAPYVIIAYICLCLNCSHSTRIVDCTCGFETSQLMVYAEVFKLPGQKYLNHRAHHIGSTFYCSVRRNDIVRNAIDSWIRKIIEIGIKRTVFVKDLLSFSQRAFALS